MEKITVEYKSLKKITDILNKRGTKPNDEVSFEFVVGSLFPHVLENIKEEMRRQYTQGYVDGMEGREMR